MRRPQLTLTALCLVIGVGVAGCSGAPGESDASAAAAASATRTLEPAANDLNLPADYEDRAVMATDWHLPPEEMDGVFVGERLIGEEQDGTIDVVAVDASGAILWELEGPPAVLCSGTLIHTTRTAEGQAIVVVTDVEEDALATPTLTAYDITSGEPVWGPVDIPGFRRGPGLVYEDAQHLDQGTAVAKVALDSATGDVIARGSELSDRHIVGEASGTLITVTNTALEGSVLEDDGPSSTVWSIPLAERRWNAEDIANRSHPDDLGDEYVAIPSGQGVADIIRIDTGEAVLTGAQQVSYDPQSGALVAATGNRVFGVHPGEEPWSYEADEDVLLMGAGDGLGYAQGAGDLIALDLRTGEPKTPRFVAGADRADAPLIPRSVSSTGAAVVEDLETRYFVAAPSA
ncbi:PQQ-binding-like beta-propeller repeat protein [Leucobacter ruminantium]|uniref:PQQ-binding-like beta-propeller repeat protein n=1 Tax=Leucobacter ruminantium TaxID=1289170 RepID=A0A939LUA2_9MICO|nr:PQQ-binding-like beta-propeller repeat protein [Leucobacter ruminantium]MBO1804507.1 PQQ-binding-like beta-propeller repeat protein [Leucobacter ruminantium]